MNKLAYVRHFGMGLALSILLASCGWPGGVPEGMVSLAEELPPAPEKNVLIISFDAFRYDRMGAYGSDIGLTPNMDEFARDALVFDAAYVAGQATPSSFAAAFTGLNPFKVFRKWSLVETQTLAKVFQSNGYTTGGFFNNQYISEERNFDQGFDAFQVMVNPTDLEPLDSIKGFLDEHGDDRFFAWVHFINPHSSYDYREMAKEFYSPDYSGEYEKQSGARVQSYDIEEMSEEDLDRIGELYNGEVHFADHRFGQVIEHVEKLGLKDDTVILMTADHGEAYREHGVLGHHQLYEEVVRVPLILRHPDGGKGGRVEVPVSNIDFLPTLASIAGLDYVAEATDGVDWREPFDPDRPLLFTQMTNDLKYSMAMRRGDLKFLMWCTPKENFEEELYHLGEDPAELDNLIDDPEFAARADEMYQTWEEMIDQHPCTAIETALDGGNMLDGLDEEAIEKLRSLGYIQ